MSSEKIGKNYPIRVCWLVDGGSYSGRGYDIPYLKEINIIVIHELNLKYSVNYSVEVDLCKYRSLNPHYIIQTTRVPASLFDDFIACLKTLSFLCCLK